MRCVIIGGAEIRDYRLMRSYFRDDDFVIYCDCGLKHVDGIGIPPSLIIGDFDSHPKPENADNVITLPVVKDDTDTIFAVKEAIRRGFSKVIMMGVTGGRSDMTLGNIYALLMLKNSGIPAVIADDWCEMSVMSAGETRKVEWWWRYFSLMNITGTARGITITGAKYNLNDGEISSDYQYGISNEVLSTDEEAVISLKEGHLLLVLVRRL